MHKKPKSFLYKNSDSLSNLSLSLSYSIHRNSWRSSSREEAKYNRITRAERRNWQWSKLEELVWV